MDDPIVKELGAELRQVLIDRGLDPDDPPDGPRPHMPRVMEEYWRRGGTNHNEDEVMDALIKATREGDMTIRTIEAQTGPESIPPRARFGFRISRSQRPFEMPWCVEVWGKPPHVYAKTESQSLFDAIWTMIIARTHKPS